MKSKIFVALLCLWSGIAEASCERSLGAYLSLMNGNFEEGVTNRKAAQFLRFSKNEEARLLRIRGGEPAWAFDPGIDEFYIGDDPMVVSLLRGKSGEFVARVRYVGRAKSSCVMQAAGNCLRKYSPIASEFVVSYRMKRAGKQCYVIDRPIIMSSRGLLFYYKSIYEANVGLATPDEAGSGARELIRSVEAEIESVSGLVK